MLMEKFNSTQWRFYMCGYCKHTIMHLLNSLVSKRIIICIMYIAPIHLMVVLEQCLCLSRIVLFLATNNFN